MSVIQVVLVVFVLFALARTFKQFQDKHLTKALFAFWSVFWIAVGLVVALPQTTEMAARFVGVGRGVDLVIYLSVLALFYLMFRLFVKIEGVEREMTRLVRKIAVDEIEEATKEQPSDKFHG